MATIASDTEPGAMYRPTRNGWAGVYLVRLADKRRDNIVKRLARKGSRCDGREIWLTRALATGWYAFERVNRYTNEDGKRVEIKDVTAVPPDYRLRQITTKPGYRKRGTPLTTE